ncbi:2-oxoglutarate dehydrogenase, E2 component, dihydrolipoamide succinyltransferase [Cryptosporangium aurantiacum]|uniref:Dihydrolipoamide acetyltransferase component of pyruvate dehydrogenase complex n=1 Tax=Cryptosporangium aurantiacum TaxID=134849 RepID=A0A1M7R7Q7_9ACTN|nr:2-oxoglutarate dehydrogenase, E2 component, dihydrolipoamide succinyltransferase [Cryptosporangium aurantiacum]SHN42365.1 2-oxoglutarate dehydrogenase E2 component [Cryptosporangium aurantiacum]
MPTSVSMPALGESVTEGTVTRWLKQVGDTVAVDEPLLEVSTDKVDTEIPSPVAGTLLSITADEDATVEVGGELGVIGEAGEDADSGAPAPAEEQTVDAPDEAPVAEAPSTDAPEDTPAPQAEAEPADGGGESTSVKMPALGESVTEGTVTRWLKQVGDTVAVDEPLLEVSTDKVDTEIPSPVAGTLLSITADEDATVEVGGELGVIGAAGAAPAKQDAPKQDAPEQEPAAQAEPESEPKPEPKQAEPENPPAEESEAPARNAVESTPPPAASAPAPSAPAPSAPAAESTDNGHGAYVTPLVRKLANEHGIDLNSVKGTGVGGRIRKQDILDAAEAKKAAAAAPAPAAASAAAPAAAPKAPAQPSPLRGRTEKLSRLRKVIAQRMVESLQVAAQLTTVVEVDVTKIAQLRQRAKNDFQARHGVKLSFLPFFAVAAVEALQQYPQVNSILNLEEGTVTYPDAEHLGIAVDTERGLLVATVREAGDLNLAGMARKIADLADRTRNNKVSPDELAGATFTLTNTGSRGALFDTPIIFQPNSAILGTGAVVKRAVVINDPNLGEVIAPRSMVYLALSYDHRIVDGADAARFLTAVKERLEGGAFEGELGLA